MKTSLAVLLVCAALLVAPLPSPVYIQDGQVYYGTPQQGTAPDRWGTLVTRNPGFPFFIPGNAGERPPQPPLDMAVLDGEPLDGGLPRHVMLSGDEITQYQNKYDWSRFTHKYEAVELEQGEDGVDLVARLLGSVPAGD